MRKQSYYGLPEKCWVGDSHKICYATEAEAEMAAGAFEYQHPGLKLTVYKCEFGEHWHLANDKTRRSR